MATVEQQLARERESKFNALQKLRTAEDEVSSLTQQVESLQEEVQSGRKDVRGSERKLAIALQAKDAELARLTRRNAVLGEAVTRLTNSAGANAAVASYLDVPSASPSMSSESDRSKDGDTDCEGDQEGLLRSHGMTIRAMTAPQGGERGLAKELRDSPGNNQLESRPSLDSTRVISPTRASTAPIMPNTDEARTSINNAPDGLLPPEPRRDTLFTSENNRVMESLFSSTQSSPVDVERLDASSLVENGTMDRVPHLVEEEGALDTPRSPSLRPDASKHADSTDSAKSDGSNASFTEKLRSEVGHTKDQDLPFSPKKAKRVPVVENPVPIAVKDTNMIDPMLSREKENEEIAGPGLNRKPNSAPSQGGLISKVRVKPQDRIGRARKFLQEKKLK